MAISFDGAYSRSQSDTSQTNPWQKFVHLIDPTFSDDFCQVLLRALPRLSEQRPVQLVEIIRQLIDASAVRMTASNQQVRMQALAVLAYALAHRIHGIVLDFILARLAEICDHTEYWESRAPSPGLHLFESGPAQWWAERPDLQQFRNAGFSPTASINSARSRASQRINAHLEALAEVESRFVEMTGELHLHMWNLEHTPHVTPDLEPCRSSSAALHLIVAGQQHDSISPPSRGGPGRSRAPAEASPDALLNLLLDTLYLIPGFQYKVLNFLRPHRRPSHYQRYWYAYAIGGAVALYAGVQAVRNRDRLVGSLVSAGKILKTFMWEHVAEPLIKIYTHVFETFSNRQIETTAQHLAASRKHLANMLLEYGKTNLKGASKADMDLIAARAAAGDMSLVMADYETQIQNPLRSTFGSSMVQAMLIQIQKLKVDTETTMLAVDQLIEANELNFQMAATIPALMISLPVLSALWNLIVSKKIPFADRRKFYQLRLLLRKIDKALTNYAVLPGKAGSAAAAASAINVGGALTSSGAGYLLLHSSRVEAITRGMLSAAELRLVREDLVDLNSPALSVVQKRFVIERMVNTLPVISTASKSLQL